MSLTSSFWEYPLVKLRRHIKISANVFMIKILIPKVSLLPGDKK
jgi:hypothetical protein